MSDTVRMNLKLDRILHYQFKRYALDCGQTLQFTIAKAMDSEIEGTEYANHFPPEPAKKKSTKPKRKGEKK